jgi:hypothetical protein
MKKWRLHGSARLLAAMIAGALVGGSVLFANPFTSSVFGQDPGATGVVATQPSSVSVLGGRAVTPATSTVATTAARPVAGAPTAGSQVVAQQPTGLPRTGTGMSADTGFGVTGALTLLAVSLALLGGGVAVRRGRARS